MTEADIAIGARFQASDGDHRHVWNVRDDRVHYFNRAQGSHWTPGHSFDDAPTIGAFLEACKPAPLGEGEGESRSQSPRAPVMDGDY